MSVSLKKGDQVCLSKNDKKLDKVIVGLGWDKVETKKSIFSPKPYPIDCDASAILLYDETLQDGADVVYFGNLIHHTTMVEHLGDNLTGEGTGHDDDERIIIDLENLPANYNKILIVINIYHAYERKQHFGLINNAFIRIVDVGDGEELYRYDLTTDAANMTAMLFGEIYLSDNRWQFKALGEGTTDPGLKEVVDRYL
ncbi:MAG: stress protein [Epulopiscium sp. Nele67-Bin005]|nr:MAG: stress protein [Epulopiscium sp. Nele67-Bin005]